MIDIRDFIMILDAYAPETARAIEAELDRDGQTVDVEEKLYEALCVHDELSAEGFRWECMREAAGNRGLVT